MDVDSAIRLLQTKALQLAVVNQLNHKDPAFIQWKDSTETILARLLLPESTHLKRFRALDFRGPARMTTRIAFNSRAPRPRPPSPSEVSPEHAEYFRRDCEVAAGCISGAVEEVSSFGVYEPPVARGRGGSNRSNINQNFRGPVTFHSQAISAGQSTQTIGSMHSDDAHLDELSKLFVESQELNRREQLDALGMLTALRAEQTKPEAGRNWRSIVEKGTSLITLADKAADIGTKLAPHIHWLQHMVDVAKTAISG